VLAQLITIINIKAVSHWLSMRDEWGAELIE